MANRNGKARTVKVEAVEHHRNGVGGEPFHVVTFTDTDAGFDGEPERAEPRRMVGVVFGGQGRVAVFDRELLGAGEIGFGVNSWRGDHYEGILREAVRKHEGEA